MELRRAPMPRLAGATGEQKGRVGEIVKHLADKTPKSTPVSAHLLLCHLEENRIVGATVEETLCLGPALVELCEHRGWYMVSEWGYFAHGPTETTLRKVLSGLLIPEVPYTVNEIGAGVEQLTGVGPDLANIRKNLARLLDAGTIARRGRGSYERIKRTL